MWAYQKQLLLTERSMSTQVVLLNPDSNGHQNAETTYAPSWADSEFRNVIWHGQSWTTETE